MLYKTETYDNKHFILDIAIFSISIFLFTLSAFTITNYPLQNRLIDDILLNWNSTLIYDITEKREECKENYTELTLDQWQGTIEGCDCSTVSDSISSKYSLKVNPFHCTSKLNEGNCKSIPSIEPVTFNSWQTNTICFNRTALNYYDYVRLAVPYDTACPAGTMQCGLLDSRKNKLCLKGRVCPINDIVMSGYRIPMNYYYEEIRMRRDYYLFFSLYAFDKFIPTQFKISQGNVCLDPYEINTFNEYVLDKNDDRRTNCSVNDEYIKFDARYRKIDSVFTKDLFKDNLIIDKIMALPSYPNEKLNNYTSLYTRSYIGWDLVCLNDYRMTPENFLEVSNKIISLNGINIATLVMIAVSSIYLGLIVFLYKRPNPKEVFNINICTGVSIDLYLIIFALGLASFIETNSINLSIYSCIDNISSIFLKPLQHKLLYSKWFFLVIFILALAFIGAILIMCLVAYILYLQEKKREEEELRRKQREEILAQNVVIEPHKGDFSKNINDPTLDDNEKGVPKKNDSLNQEDLLLLRSKQEMERKKRLEEEEQLRKKREEEEAERRRKAEEARRRRIEEEEEERRRRKIEEEAERIRLGEEERKRRLDEEEEIRKRKLEDEERRLKMIEDTKRRKLEEEERLRKLEKERLKKEEEDRKRKDKELDRWGNDSDDDRQGNGGKNVIEYK